ncbi:MAG: efflux RND transporter periplasmic adaptor subunit [Shinella sp.]|nr:efflux RND transporter periplasmic adaptor subunit [Shinella sp.]
MSTRVISAVAVLVVAAAAGGMQRASAAESSSPAVRIEAIRYGGHEQTITLTGEVAARVQTDLSFRVGGRITGWFVDVGAQVKAGQLLATLDPEEQRADVEAAEASVRAAEAQLKLARTSFERQQSLLREGIATRRDLDEAETALRTAEGSLEATIAQRETAADVLSYTELRAPSDGIITVRNAESGQVAQAAQPMFTLADLGPRDAIFDVYESLFFQRPSAAAIEIMLVSDPEVRTTGEVREVSPTIDPANGTVRVKIGMRRTPLQMTLGSSVVGVGRIAAKRVAVVPWDAVSGVGNQPALWVVKPDDNTVELRPVEVSSFESGVALVASGVEDGERFVAAGTKLLRPGQVVGEREETK